MISPRLLESALALQKQVAATEAAAAPRTAAECLDHVLFTGLCFQPVSTPSPQRAASLSREGVYFFA